MSLPPGFLDELRNRVSLADVVGRKVMWDSRKSQQGKGEFWAPCPFHQEKTASFKVDDRKGYYYCFGCQAKGDMITFVRETENVGFMDAVGLLAQEAGMEMPAPDPQARAKADRASQIAEVCEAALQWFRLELQRRPAEAARGYLERRGLSRTAWDRFELGFAPASYTALQEALKAKGIDPELIAAAGLSKMKEGGRPYDVFRDRIMFPIRDARGRAIAFGGRAMDPDAPAKYLNSPETELFNKSRTLYNHAPARRAAGEAQPLIVAEGYMDVIALVEAGFEATVACLGTALTETHLSMLWKMAEEPVLALDGDKAGIRAAHRSLDLALPHLAPGKSLRFALLPEGKDPDDLLKSSGGKAAMTALVEGAQPLIEVLWARAVESHDLSTPERRASFDADLRQRLRAIQDATIRQHYSEAIRAKREELFGFGRRQQPIYRKANTRTAAPRPQTQALAQTSPDELLEATLLALAFKFPALHEELADALDAQVWSTGAHEALAQNLLGAQADIALYLEMLWARGHIRINPALKDEATEEMARACAEDVMGKLAARRGHHMEVNEALEDMQSDDVSSLEATTWRLAEATASHAQAYRVSREERLKEDDGADEMSNYLQNLLDSRVWEKKKR